MTLPTTRKEAMSLGIKWYLTGGACVYGHVSKRYTPSGECYACRVLRVQDWRKRNPKAVKQHLHRQYVLAPGKAKANARKWARANPTKVLADVRVRQAGKNLRTPKWLSADDFWIMQEFYELAATRSTMTGFAWHVDHVIPLRGRNVSGLHVPSNLAVVPAIYNMNKANRYEVAF